MDNAIDALHIAAGVLIFVVALSISINAFSEVRITSQTILNYRDREYDYTYVEENQKQATDESGNPVFDGDGNPVMESVTERLVRFRNNYSINV